MGNVSGWRLAVGGEPSGVYAGSARPWRGTGSDGILPSVTEPPLVEPHGGATTSLLTPSLVALVLANLWPLVGVLFLHWTVFSVLLLFWLENVIVGVFNVARMWMAGDPGPGGQAAKLFVIPFFIVHYGLFTAIHGLFVFALFAGTVGLTPELVGRVVAEAGILPAALILAASHGYSFVINYLGSGDFRTANLQTLMFQPYSRVVILHLVIMFGGVTIVSLGAPTGALALLVVLKIGIDAAAHLREHGLLRHVSGLSLTLAIRSRRREARRAPDDR